MAGILTRIWKEHRWFILLLAGATFLRLAYLQYYASLPDWNQLTVDNYYHLHWAQRIADGDIWGGTTFFRAPLYVYLLSVVIALCGDSLWTLRIFCLLIGVASVGLTYLLARSFLSRNLSLVAAFIHAIYPTAVYFDGELLLDPLFTLLVQLALWRTLQWWKDQTIRGAFWCGIFWGLASITRPTALVLAAALLIAILLWKNAGRIRIRSALALVAGLFLCVAPITIRNLAVAGDPVLIASQGGINFFIGNNSHADGISAVLPQPFGHNWQIADISYVAEVKEGEPLTPGQVSDYWTGQAYQWILHHPLDWLSLTLKKLYYSISDREISNNRDMDAFFTKIPYLGSHPLSFAWVFALGMVGAIAGWRSSAQTKILSLTVLLFIVANSLFFVNSRFRLPEISLLIILSISALAWILRNRNYRTRHGLIGLAAAIVLFLFSFLPVVGFPVGTDVTGLASQGIFHYRLGAYQRAIQIGHQILDRDPKFPEANLNIGAAWFRLGDGDSAKYYFERERGLYPGRPRAYTNLASYYLVNHQYDSSYIKLNRALLLRPYDLSANTLLIRTAAADNSVGETELAGYLTSILTETDSNLVIMLEAAKAASGRQLFPLAEQLLRSALSTAPPPVETDDLAFDEAYPYTPVRLRKLRAQTHYELGFVLGQTGRFEESISESRQAIALDSSLSAAYVNLFSGFVSTGQLRSADSVLSRASALFPNDPTIRQLLTRLKQ